MTYISTGVAGILWDVLTQLYTTTVQEPVTDAQVNTLKSNNQSDI